MLLQAYFGTAEQCARIRCKNTHFSGDMSEDTQQYKLAQSESKFRLNAKFKSL